MKSVLCGVLLCVIAVSAFGQAPDLILFNGHVITLDAGVVEEALAIQDGIITRAGKDFVVLALAGSDTKQVNLMGKTVLPGFVEGHSHIVIDRPQDMDMSEVSSLIASYGYSTVNEMVGYTWFVEELQQAADDGSLKVRVNVFPNHNYGHLTDGASMLLKEFYPDHEPILDPNELVRVPGIKLFVDGAFTADRGCWALSRPYREDFQQSPSFLATGCGPYGTLYENADNIRSVVKELQEKGFRVAMHALGDSAITIALDAIESAIGNLDNRQFRHAIHHGGMIREDQLSRYQEMGVVASVRGMFQTCIQSLYTDTWFSPEQVPLLVNRYKVPDVTHAFMEGDFAWTSDPEDQSDTRQINPWINIWALVTHQQLDSEGNICKPLPWVAEHQVSLQRALEMYTIEGAYAVSMEDHIGSISEGKFADLMVIEQDPFSIDENMLKEIRPLWTLRGGETIFCRETFDLDCELTSSLEGGETSGWQIYPTLTNGMIHLENMPSGSFTLSIVNFWGRVIEEIRTNTLPTILNVSELTPGMYAVLLVNDHQVQSRTFIRH